MEIKNNKLQCMICYEDNVENEQQLNKCECTVCIECHSLYIIDQIQEISFNLEKMIRCPNYECHQTYAISEITNKYPLLYKNQIYDKLNQYYLQNTSDIRNCPNPKCNYYGIIIDCKDDFICEKCSYQWQDYDKNKKKINLKNILKFFTLKNEIFSQIYEQICTEACPKCGVFICRNGGCLHMTCKKCLTEFCWLCKQQHYNHSPNLCVSHLASKYGIVLYLIVNMIVILQYHIPIFNAVAFIFEKFLTLIFYDLILIPLWFLQIFLGEFIQLQQSIRHQFGQNNFTLSKRKKALFNTLFFLICSVGYFIGIWYIDDSILPFFLYFCYQVFLLSIGWMAVLIVAYIHDTYVMFVR